MLVSNKHEANSLAFSCAALPACDMYESPPQMSHLATRLICGFMSDLTPSAAKFTIKREIPEYIVLLKFMIYNLAGIKGSDNQDNQRSIKHNQSHCGQRSIRFKLFHA